MFRTIRAWFTSTSGTTPGTRFKRGDEPTEGNFKKLFESVAFIAEADDTAKPTEQGLAKSVSDQDALDKKSNDSSGMTRFIKPHQTTSVSHVANSGVKVYPSEADRYQNGVLIGKGKDYSVANDMQVSAGPGGLITVNQPARGKDVIIDLNGNAIASLNSGKVKVELWPGSGDPAPGYLNEKIQIQTTETLYTAPYSYMGTQRLGIGFKYRPRAVEMWYGTVAQMDIDFPGGYARQGNVPDDHPWIGWAVCNGQIANGYQTPDMRENVPVGFCRDTTTGYGRPGGDLSGKYPVMQAGAGSWDSMYDKNADYGRDELPIPAGSIPGHVHHVSQNINVPDHSHAVTINPATVSGVAGAVVGGGTFSGATDTPNTGLGGAHVVAVDVDSDVQSGAGTDPMPVRQPFQTMLFVMYVGY